MKIVQVTESLALGDAVANDTVAIDGLLKKMGVCGGIYVTNSANIHKRYLHSIAEPINALPPLEPDDVLLFHHAIANNFCERIPALPCKKVLIYHNITPPHFFKGMHQGFYDACLRGLEQLSALKDVFDCCIADSAFNRENLLDIGFLCPIYICPVLIPFSDYEKEPNQDLIRKYTDGRTNLLFVGRVSPNKKQEDIIHTFAVYKKYYDPTARLFLVGSDGVEAYDRCLREYVDTLGVPDVIFTGSVPLADILAYYSVADAFVCMSEHEGFCVPLIEAMYFDVPIVAYESSAIPYTLSDSGVLLHKKDYALAAGWLHRIVTDETVRSALLVEQRERLCDFSSEGVAAQMEAILRVVSGELESADLPCEVWGPGDHAPKNLFALVMPIKASDWDSARKNIRYIRENIRPKKIVMVSSEELKVHLPVCEDIEFINENELIPGLSLSAVKGALLDAGGEPRFAGWYLQQFLKLGYSRFCNDEYYLVWDADTLPIRPVEFFDRESGKPYLNLKREYVAPYFTTINTLLGLGKGRSESYITEHMFFHTEACRKMLTDFEANRSIKGSSFWEKCIYGAALRESAQSFSEYETFGTYVSDRFPELYTPRKMCTLRCGQEFLGSAPSAEVLAWVAKDFDTVSFEHWGNESALCALTRNPTVREQFSFAEFVRYAVSYYKLRACTGNVQDAEFYSKLQPELDFDWFFGGDTVYDRLTQMLE